MNEKTNRMTTVRPTIAKTTDQATAQAAFVSGKGKKKRLILDVSPALHAKIKSSCAARGVSMVEELTAILEAKYPSQAG